MTTKKSTKSVTKKSQTKKPNQKITKAKHSKKTTETKTKAKNTKRKVAAKKVSVKKDILSKCNKGKEFVLCNEDKIASLLELADELGNIDEHIYKHHVNNEKNDFSNWIEHVFADKTLAKKIKNLNMHNARIQIYRYLIESLRR